MDNINGKIGLYIEKNKKNSKLNKTEVSEVVTLLKEVLDRNNSSIDDVINILLELHYSVTEEFFRNVFVTLNEQVKNDLISKFLSADKIVKNASNFGINRTLIIVNELLQTTGNDEYIHTVLKASAKKAYGKDGGQKAGELLCKICFKKSKGKLFLLDYLEWQETELRNFSVWLDNAITHTTDAEIIANYYAFVEKYNLPKSKKTDVMNVSIPKTDVNTTMKPQKTEIDNTAPKKEHREKITILVSELELEADRIVNERLKLSKEIEEIKSKLEQLNKDKVGLEMQLSEANIKNSLMQEQIGIKDKEIIDSEKKIAEMNERLEYAYKADKRAENQELTSLKNDIIKELKLDYEAFKKLSSKEPEQYHLYYEGLMGVVENIFDSLRRKGIVINNENEG